MYKNLEMERAMLAAINIGYTKYLDNLTEDDFTAASYKAIYRAMAELKEKDMPIDITTIATASTEGKENQISPAIVSQAMSGYYDGMPYDKYLKILKDCTAKRKIQEGVSLILAELEKNDAMDAKAKIVNYFNNVDIGIHKNIAFSELMDKTIDEMKEYEKRKGETGNYTGIADIDQATGGLHPGEVTVLAARPGIGKTAMALQIALEFVKKGKKVLFFSREMSDTNITRRLISSFARIDGHRMRINNMNEEDWADVKKMRKYTQGWEFYVDDKSSTVSQIRATVNEENEKKKVDLIVIDYLQLLMTDKRTNNREQEVAEMSRQVKLISLELGIPIVLLSQLNRDTGNKQPRLDNLRESGAVEQDADNVLFIHVPDIDNLKGREQAMARAVKEAGNIYVQSILAKQRNGRTGIFPLAYNGKYIKFENLIIDDTPMQTADKKKEYY